VKTLRFLILVFRSSLPRRGFAQTPAPVRGPGSGIPVKPAQIFDGESANCTGMGCFWSGASY